ncbi:hypothetical protein GCM10022267_85770 [Lentzea roselyniae]|uniref:Uncharacterized protein n=1 Tax=Lentzea roselyniae TaxID=531940 RepID=A0ABP7CEE3_9PSEU
MRVTSNQNGTFAALAARYVNVDVRGNERTGARSPLLISHNMAHVFEIADRIHVQRLGARPSST